MVTQVLFPYVTLTLLHQSMFLGYIQRCANANVLGILVPRRKAPFNYELVVQNMCPDSLK